jgi:hypothetical protein
VSAFTRRTKFTTWLRQQNKRRDPVGDLARDYIGDSRSKGLTKAELRRHIREVGCLDASHAFVDAFSEFAAQRRALPK